MCGIIGYYAFGEAKPTPDILNRLFVACMDRGEDATGLAYVKDNQLQVLKSGVCATEFIKKEEVKELFSAPPKYMTMHTRAGTKGSEDDNKNNHPVFSKSGIAITHNGVISNDDSIFEVKNYEREGKVDSEVVLRILENATGTIRERIREMSYISGSFACSAIDVSVPDTLILFKHNNPIEVYYDEDTDIMYYASTKSILVEGLGKSRTTKRGFIIKEPLQTMSVDDDYCLIIDEDGIYDYFDFYDSTRSIWKYQQYNRESRVHTSEPHKSYAQARCDGCKKFKKPEDLMYHQGKHLCWVCLSTIDLRTGYKEYI